MCDWFWLPLVVMSSGSGLGVEERGFGLGESDRLWQMSGRASGGLLGVDSGWQVPVIVVAGNEIWAVAVIPCQRAWQGMTIRGFPSFPAAKFRPIRA